MGFIFMCIFWYFAVINYSTDPQFSAFCLATSALFGLLRIGDAIYKVAGAIKKEKENERQK